jgi:hypothetical protein
MQVIKGYNLVETQSGDVKEFFSGPISPNSFSIKVSGSNLEVCGPEIDVVYHGHKLIPVYEEIADVVPGTPTVPPVVANAIITRRQFYQQAAIAGFITQDDALNALAIGKIPPALEAVVNQLNTDDEKFAARMLLIGAEFFDKNNSLVENVRVALNLTEEDITNFFAAASLL